MQRRPVTADERTEIQRRHAAGETRNQIARALGRSASTISRIAGELGLRFEGGARTAAATEARRLDLAALRRDLVERLYLRAAANLDRVEAPDGYVRVELLPDGRTVRVVTDAPPAQDERHHSHAIGTYLSSAQRLADVDSDGESRGASMLDRLADALLGPANGGDDEGG